ncbi:MAG: PTS sugar transporter subunit IIB [Faecalibacillus faecis]
MEKASQGLLSVKAYGEAEYEEYANNYDLILLGPQIRHLKPEIESKVSIPVDYIAPQHYGIMNGEAVFQDIKNIKHKRGGIKNGFFESNRRKQIITYC